MLVAGAVSPFPRLPPSPFRLFVVFLQPHAFFLAFSSLFVSLLPFALCLAIFLGKSR